MCGTRPHGTRKDELRRDASIPNLAASRAKQAAGISAYHLYRHFEFWLRTLRGRVGLSTMS